MTREERLDLLKQIEKDIYVPSIESTFLDDAKSCAIHSAIEELEQEPFGPMVEIDLDYIIKQKYIEREVLDKIRAEIKKQQYGYMGRTDYEEGVRFGLMLAHQILDKYKADREALAECYKPKLKADLCIIDEFAFDPEADRSEDDGND